MEGLSDIPSVTYGVHQNHINETAGRGKTEVRQNIWRLRDVCGYEYIGDELPEDFVCPLCKHPKIGF